MIGVCWQTWRDITEETAVALIKGWHYVGLRRQQLRYHNAWDFWYITFLVRFCVLHCADVGSAYWR